MKVLRANSKWIMEGDIRMDASFHLSKGRLTRKQLDKSPLGNRALRSLSNDIFYGGRAKRVYVEDEVFGLPFMGSADMLKSDLDSLKFISRKLTKNIETLLLKEGWILISRSGTIGNTVYVGKDYIGKAASEHIIRIIPKNDCKSGYLYAFLTSQYGYALLTQGTFGAVIQHIEPDYLSDIPIPILSEGRQDKIHHLILEANQLRADGNSMIRSLVRKVESLLKSTYGKSQKVKASSRSISDITHNEKRIDAPYNIGVGRMIFDKMICDEHLYLSQVADVFHPILFGKKQLKGSEIKGNPLFKSSSMIKMKPETDFWLSLKKISAYSKLQVKEGWILVSRTGTVGNVVRINRTMNNVFIDDHMIRIKPKERYAGMIYIYLKCYYGQRLIEFQKYGSVQEVINSEYIDRIPIPKFLLDEDLLDEFDSQVKHAANKIDEAFLKENTAIDLVEKEIESWQ